uniref:C-type lectin domain-containing protein n=1 Tax=Caenorhabditis japonica TaxID=281687 RepID=A0A8R1HI47_CAEJA
MPDKDEENAPCQLYRFGNITAIKKLDEGSRKRVGFKVNVHIYAPSTPFSTHQRKLEQPEDMCPFSDDPPMFGDASFSLGYISDKTYYGVNISMYKDEWIFHYFTSKCVLTSSTLFVRCQVAVCLELRWFTKPPYMNNQANASMLCKEKNGLGLTGNYNADEYSWMASEATPKKAQAAGIPDYEVGKGIWFWVDGKSEKRLKQFVMEDDTHGGTSAYPWWTNQPDGTDVLFCLYMLYRQNYIDDIWWVKLLQCPN